MPHFLGITATIAMIASALTVKGRAEENSIDLSFQWIEVELADWNDLLMQRDLPLRGPAMKKAVDTLIVADKATVLRQMAVKSRNGNRAKAEAIRELTYANEYTPATISDSGKVIIRPTVAGTEARNLGTTIEADLHLSDPKARARFEPKTAPLERSRILGVNFGVTETRHMGNREWGKDEAAVSFPDFHNNHVTTFIELLRGETRFVSSFAPAETGGDNHPQKRILLFVRADFPELKPVNLEDIDFPLNDLTSPEKASSLPPPLIDDYGIRYQILETELAKLNELLNDNTVSTAGVELRKALVAKNATLVETIAMVGHVEQRLDYRSGLELIYPTEWDEPQISKHGNLMAPASPVAMQQWNLGTSIELEIQRRDGADQFTSSGRFEYTRLREIRRFGKGVAEVSFPLFHRRELTQNVPMGDGELVFLGTLRPDEPTAKDRVQPIWAIFGRIDSLPNP